MAKFVFLLCVGVLVTTLCNFGKCNSVQGTFNQCNLRCSNDEELAHHQEQGQSRSLIRGKSGPRGPKGERGLKGEPGVTQEFIDELEERVAKLEKLTSLQQALLLKISKPQSCSEIQMLDPDVEKGNFTLYQSNADENGCKFFCPMTNDNNTAVPIEKILDCSDVVLPGVYSFCSPSALLKEAYCDSGWTVIQNRFEGSQSFQQNYTTYVSGFGTLTGEFWLGLEKIYSLTQEGSWSLRVELVDFDGNKQYAEYSYFSLDANRNYALTVRGYTGNTFLGDLLSVHNGREFTTYDSAAGSKCSKLYGRGGWWYTNCHPVNLNGIHYNSMNSVERAKGIVWGHNYRGYDWNYSLRSSIMKIRRN